MIAAQAALFSLLALGCSPAVAYESKGDMVEKQILIASVDGNSSDSSGYNEEQEASAEHVPEGEYEDVPEYEEQGDYPAAGEGEQGQYEDIEGEFEQGGESVDQEDLAETEGEYVHDEDSVEGECLESEECDDAAGMYEQHEGESYPEGGYEEVEAGEEYSE